jgi:HEAT repeat protein
MNILLLILQALLLALVYLPPAEGQSLDKLNRFVQAQPPSAAATAFREARDLIKDGEWEKAEARFNRFIAEFPQDREAAAALYWLAFSLKQQSKYADADTSLTRLIKQYPASTWINDARAMRVEMAPRLQNSQVIEQAVVEANDEIKLAALQSLFEARPERAFTIAADILKAGGSSRLLKEGALTLLADSETKEALAVIVEMARTESDIRLRTKAIESLEEFEDEPGIVDAVIKLLAAEKDPRLQEELLEVLGDLETEAATQSLIQFYDTEKDERLKENILEALGDSEHKAALIKLTQIAARDPSMRLRKQALVHIGKSDDPDAIKFLEDLLKKN